MLTWLAPEDKHKGLIRHLQSCFLLMQLGINQLNCAY